jgi:general secretion pathway protein C
MTFKLQSSTLLISKLVKVNAWLCGNAGVTSRILTIILLMGCAWIAGTMVWLPMQNKGIERWQAQLTQVNHQSPLNIDVTMIKQRQLFGEYQTKDVTSPTRAIVLDAPKTQLALRLVGVAVVYPHNASLAIIAHQRKQDTYGIGDPIDGTRAKMVDVYHDRVVIDNAGRHETLMLLDVDYDSTSNKSFSNRFQRLPELDDKPAVEYDENRLATANHLAKIRQEILKNPSQLFQYVRLSMLKRGRDIVGYRLSPGSSEELFNSVGLKSGDIATKINGVDLRDQNAMTKLESLMKDLSEVNLTVERDGEPLDIYIQL